MPRESRFAMAICSRKAMVLGRVARRQQVEDLADVSVVFVEVDRVEQARNHDDEEHEPHQDEIGGRNLDDALLQRFGRNAGGQAAYISRVHGTTREDVVDAKHTPQDRYDQEPGKAPHVRRSASRHPPLAQLELVVDPVVSAQELEHPRPHDHEEYVDVVEGASPQLGDGRRDVQPGDARHGQKYECSKGHQTIARNGIADRLRTVNRDGSISCRQVVLMFSAASLS